MYLIHPVNLSYFDSSLHSLLLKEGSPRLSGDIVENVILNNADDWGKVLYALSEGRISKGYGRLLADIRLYSKYVRVIPYANTDLFMSLYCELTNIEFIMFRMGQVIEYYGDDIIRDYSNGLSLIDISKKYLISLDSVNQSLYNFCNSVRNDNYYEYILSNNGKVPNLRLIDDLRLDMGIRSQFKENNVLTSIELFNSFKRIRTYEGGIRILKKIGINGDLNSVLNNLIKSNYIPQLLGTLTPIPIIISFNSELIPFL